MIRETLALAAAAATLAWPLPAQAHRVEFERCPEYGKVNCVADGDHIWLYGEEVRLEGFTTPSATAPACHAEAELGERAAERLREVLSAGDFDVTRVSPYNENDDGLVLRTIIIGSEEVGAILVREGLARPGMDKAPGWCG